MIKTTLKLDLRGVRPTQYGCFEKGFFERLSEKLAETIVFYSKVARSRKHGPESLVHPKGGMSRTIRLFFFHATEKKGAAKVTDDVEN